MSEPLSRERIVLISFGESFAGRPPLRPRARAAFKPATVLSRIRLRSNPDERECGENMKDQLSGRRAGFNLLRQRFEVDATVFEFGYQPDQVAQIPA
jgi:hypothetical protein